MKYNQIFAVIAILSTALFTGCDLDDNAFKDFAYTEIGGSHIVTDQFGNSLSFNRGEAAQLAKMEPSAAKEYLTQYFRAENPEDYPSPTIKAETTQEVSQGELVVSEKAKGVIAATKMIPVWGEVASYGLNGLLAVGAIWLKRKGSKAQKVSKSLVQGIDTFRDILDQTPQGSVIDNRLKDVLRERQTELGTIKEVTNLLDRYATPTKTPIPLDRDPN